MERTIQQVIALAIAIIAVAIIVYFVQSQLRGAPTPEIPSTLTPVLLGGRQWIR